MCRRVRNVGIAPLEAVLSFLGRTATDSPTLLILYKRVRLVFLLTAVATLLLGASPTLGAEVVGWPAATQVGVGKRRVGLIVGVDSYREPSLRLRYATKDARDLHSLLVGKLGFPATDVTVLLDDQATRENILLELGRKLKGLTNQDEFVFYFSGHGRAIEREHGRMSFLLGADSTLELAEVHGIPIDQLLQRLGQEAVGHVLVLLDACSLGQEALPTLVSQVHAGSRPRNVGGRSRKLILGARRDQLAWERAENGLFTSALRSFFESQLCRYGYAPKMVSSAELFSWVQNRMALVSGSDQQPVQQSFASADGEFYFDVLPGADLCELGFPEGDTPLVVTVPGRARLFFSASGEEGFDLDGGDVFYAIGDLGRSRLPVAKDRHSSSAYGFLEPGTYVLWAGREALVGPAGTLSGGLSGAVGEKCSGFRTILGQDLVCGPLAFDKREAVSSRGHDDGLYPLLEKSAFGEWFLAVPRDSTARTAAREQSKAASVNPVWLSLDSNGYRRTVGRLAVVFFSSSVPQGGRKVFLIPYEDAAKLERDLLDLASLDRSRPPSSSSRSAGPSEASIDGIAHLRGLVDRLRESRQYVIRERVFVALSLELFRDLRRVLALS